MGSENGLKLDEFPPLISQNSKDLAAMGASQLGVSVLSDEGNIRSDIKGGNLCPKDWRKIFPAPRPIISQPKMKFTPPVEINGKKVVASVTDNSSDGVRNCEMLVVGFFAGKRGSFAAVQNAVSKFWKLKQELSIKLHGNCAFIFEFKDEDDMKNALELGFFYIASNLFSVRPWSLLIENTIAEIKTVPIWVLIFGVPLHLWNSEGLSLSASYVGTPLFADECTINKDRLSYARICIEIGVDCEYLVHIPVLIDGKTALELLVEYQWKPPKCIFCKVFGHDGKMCPAKKKSMWVPKKDRFKTVEANVDIGFKEDEVDKNSFELKVVSSIDSVDNGEIGGTISNQSGGSRVPSADGVSRSNLSLISSSVGVSSTSLPALPEQATKMVGAVLPAVGVNSSISTTTKPADVDINGSAQNLASNSKMEGAGVGSRCSPKQMQAEKDGEWTEVKGRKITKKVSPKKGNSFMVYSAFKSESRFPIDRKKEDEEFEKKFKSLTEEQKSEKRQERELRRLKMYIPGSSAGGSDSPGRGLRSQNKKN